MGKLSGTANNYGIANKGFRTILKKMKYTERQIGWFVIVPVPGILVLLLIFYINQWGSNPISYSGLLIMFSIFIICATRPYTEKPGVIVTIESPESQSAYTAV